jgi:hypothetical protein
LAVHENAGIPVKTTKLLLTMNNKKKKEGNLPADIYGL